MDSSVIKSYLVSLGFTTDQPSLVKFEGAMVSAERVVAGAASGMLGDLLKFQAGAIGVFGAVGFALVGYVDKLAMSDQQMRLFAMRSFMTLQQARSVQTALSALGVKLEDVAWDKELHRRFLILIDDQRQLAAMLGPGYEKQMHDVRDIVFQLQRLEVKGEYFGMKFVSDLLRKLGIGDGTILGSLEKLNDFVLKNMPQWSDEISTDLLPILKDMWSILKSIGGLAADLALEFTNVMGVLSGNSSIQGATFNFHNFAIAVETAAHWVAVLVQGLFQAERLAVRFAPVLAGAAGGAALGSVIPGLGTGVGAILGGVAGAGVMAVEELGRYGGAKGATAAASRAGGSIADQARAQAARISSQTGIDADLIYGQMAFESGNFTSRQARTQNNLSGIKYPGTNTFRTFDSLDDFGNHYAKVLGESRYVKNGIQGAHTGADYAKALKTPSGTYYGTDDQRAYGAGVDKYRGDYGGGGSSITIGSIPIAITNPGASTEQIHRAVQSGVKAGIDAHVGNQMTELSGAYQ